MQKSKSILIKSIEKTSEYLNQSSKYLEDINKKLCTLSIVKKTKKKKAEVRS